MWSDIVVVAQQVKNDAVKWRNEKSPKWCQDWYEREKQDPPSFSGLLPCPCTRRQATSDDRFEDDPACTNGVGCVYHHGAYHCIRSMAAR